MTGTGQEYADVDDTWSVGASSSSGDGPGGKRSGSKMPSPAIMPCDGEDAGLFICAVCNGPRSQKKRSSRNNYGAGVLDPVFAILLSAWDNYLKRAFRDTPP